MDKMYLNAERCAMCLATAVNQKPSSSQNTGATDKSTSICSTTYQGQAFRI